MKVLIIQQKMIGDVLTCSTLCELIKQKHPNYEVHYLINSNTKPVVENNPFIDTLLEFKPEYKTSKIALLKFLFSIRKQKYDVVIDAYSKIESNLITMFSGASKKISFRKYYSKYIYTNTITPKTVPVSNLGLAIEHRQQLLEPLGITFNMDTFPKLHVTPKENQEAISLLEKHHVPSGKKIVMVSIIGSAKNKTYPLNYMSDVVDYIAETSDFAILFNYIPNQIEDAKAIYNSCKSQTKKSIYFNVLGNNLRSFIALMNRCEYIIGNDGGAINMAKALNKPSFIIFSPWIDKKTWATFEDGTYHKSVHLKDYKPELFTGKSTTTLKKETNELYKSFTPSYFKGLLENFIQELDQKNLETYHLSESAYKNNITPLTALVITYNEEKNIKALLQNLDFATHIIVVDSFSTDNTVAIVKQHSNTTLIQHTFVNFSAQRNFALAQATTDWILFIDADERITPNLKTAIQTVINKKNNDVVAYEMFRNFYFKKQLVRFSGWQTDKVFRLYRRGAVSYKKELLVHEALNINGKTAVLQPKLDHFSFESYADYKHKMMHYAKLRALELFSKKTKPNAFHFYIKPSYRFINNFILRLGFLDGKKGFIISYLGALYVHHRYVKLKELYSQDKK